MGRRRVWMLVLCASTALVLVGVLGWVSLVNAERDIRAARLVPPHRGAATTLAGAAIGFGVGGLIIGAAALMPNRK